MNSDEDAPPPLDSLEDQVKALSAAPPPTAPQRRAADGLAQGDGSGAEDADTALPVATINAVGGKASAPLKLSTKAQRPAIRRGFFDAPAKSTHTAAQRSSNSRRMAAATTASSHAAAVPLLRAPNPTAAATRGSRPGGAVPDFLMLPPDARMRARDTLISALAPTPDTLAAVASDPALAAGFEDPRVMAAVAEVAANPAAIQRYQGDAQVMEFYQQMGRLLGGRLEQAAAVAEEDGGSGGKAGGAAAAGRGPQQLAPSAEVRWR